MTADGLSSRTRGNELTAAVATVYSCFLEREPDAVNLTLAHYGARIEVEGGRSLLEMALLSAGREDLFREERQALAPPMLEALQARAESVLRAPIEELRIESDLDSNLDTFLLVLHEPLQSNL